MLPWIPAAIGAASSLASNVFGGISQGAMNRKNRAWQEKMYERQRMDANSDWLMMNEYNSPKAQMQRFRDAGLNESLIYGQGTSSNAVMPRSVSPGQSEYKAFQPDLSGVGSSIMSIMDVRMKEAQIDNLEASNTVIQQQGLINMYKAIKEGTDIRMSEDAVPGNMYESLKVTQLQAAKQMIEKTKAETQFSLNENERRALVTSQSLTESVERIISMRQGRELSKEQVQSIRKDVQLKSADLELRKKWNLSPSDPLYIRLLSVFLEKLGINP